MPDQTHLAALIGSRICHDLISPIGAIGNGLELMTMTGSAQTPEMQLIADSVAQANARIRLFRIAFGLGGEETTVSKSEAVSILSDMTHGSRLQIDWLPAEGLTREATRIAFLLILCLETAMPYGGRITVTAANDIRAEAARLRPLPELWAVLRGADTPVKAAHVQFRLAALAIGSQISVDEQETAIHLAY
ncbi:histidine phosphotransferase family protein [Falsirhodobacter sp. alg1]|uniref:histidine phosphotransferase family protein n=1 Tax=Falsirhodobacter sp. alg1 TaxID=1472418 RepID=UPI0007871ED8|nr:histidine phosphotransferase family protein [Falsirhodobacter sp. alg1]